MPLRKLESSIAAAGQVLLLLDFDGTLAPIAERPALAALPGRSRQVLEELALQPRVTVAVISGRALADLRARVGLPITYAGNHGLEIEGPGFQFRAPNMEQTIATLPEVSAALLRTLGTIPGAFVENKGLTISVHFRQVDVSRVPELRQLILTACTPHADSLGIYRGRKVFEIRPKIGWNKGTAACWIQDQLRESTLVTICIGDDVSDEDMFRALPDALSIRVGPGPTVARFRLDGTAEVIDLLERVLRAIKRSGDGLG